MPAVPSVTGTAAYDSAALTLNFTFTVNSGDTLAVFWLVQDSAQTITSVTWDQGGTNQACTLVASQACPTASNGKVYKYAVVNPTPGTKTLRVVNAVATGITAELQSYTGTVTSSVAAACANALTASGTNIGAVGTAAQSGANGDMYVSAYVSAGIISAVNQTPIDASGTGIIFPAAFNRAASTGASIALTANVSNISSEWAAVSCDVVAALVVAGQPRPLRKIRRR